MKWFLSQMLPVFVLASTVLCWSCSAEQSPAGSPSGKPTSDANQLQVKTDNKEQPQRKQPDANAPAIEPNVVAKVGEYVITRQELQKRLMMELYPYNYEQSGPFAAAPEAKTVLTKMLAEKAMIIEGRKQNLLEDPSIRDIVKRFRDRTLANLLLQTQLQSKLTVTESEIEEKLKADPKLNRAQAKTLAERTKANQLLDGYYKDIYAKFHVQKVTDNFAKAAEIHQRLLLSPKIPRDMPFIRISQIETDLTAEERDLTLVTFDGGKVTLKDWLDTLCEVAPPRRPTDLNTPEGVERLLNIALRIPILVNEAKLLGLDKDRNFVKQVKDIEDSHVLQKVQLDKFKDINEPTKEQIIDYYNKNKESFITDRTIKIDQIWCQDLKTAQQTKAQLDGGKDFESVKQLYSLEKTGKPFDTYIGSEGIFFKDLWKGEPNQILGPLKGFYNEGIKWRIVKILEKKPGAIKVYSDDISIRESVKWRMISEQRNALLEKYGKALLEKYKFEIYEDKIKDIDPLNIP